MRIYYLFVLLVCFSTLSVGQKVLIEGQVKSIIYANDNENTVPGVLIKDPITNKTLSKTDTYGKFSFRYDISKNKDFIIQRKEFITVKWRYKKSKEPIVIYIDPDSDKFVKITKGKALDKEGKPVKGAKAMNSYYNRAEYSDNNGEFVIRIPNPKYLEQWESKSDAENLVITVSKEGLKVAELRPNYQSTLDELIVKLMPKEGNGETEELVENNDLEIIEADIERNLVQLDTLKKMNQLDVLELKEYISYLEDKLNHHEYTYAHEELGQSNTVNHNLHLKLDTLKQQVLARENMIVKVQKQKNVLQWSLSAIIFILIPTIIAFLMYRSKRKTEKLNVVLDKQNKQLDMAYSDIRSSVLYAEKIQRSIMINPSEIKKSFEDVFIFYRPKDIVSGDFYWFSSINNKLVIAAIDCTGHGIPGAFMTMMGNAMLNEIVNITQITSPSKILESLDEKVINSLQSGNEKLKDGMDVAIAVVDTETQKLSFCGANNPLLFISESELKTLDANRRGIGGDWQMVDEEFKDIIIDLKDISSFYLFSDGFQDQFGGKDDRKFMKKNFKSLLLDASEKPFKEQEEYIVNRFDDWKGNGDQTDDILVIGVKL